MLCENAFHRSSNSNRPLDISFRMSLAFLSSLTQTTPNFLINFIIRVPIEFVNIHNLLNKEVGFFKARKDSRIER